jgi:anti-sigma regulatory factor (Ser/Thr protein kinase)
VRLALAARPENVAVVRDVVSGIGDVVDLAGRLDDVKIAVSEAANNVVMHAYGGGEGSLEVDLRILPGALEVLVRDHGVGIDPQFDADAIAAEERAAHGPGHGLGLGVIGALADRLELRPQDPRGLEVVMEFATAPLEEDGVSEPDVTDLTDFEWLPAGEGALHLAITPPTLSAAVLARVVCAAAARAGFSIDRLSDAQLVADALAAHIEPALSDPRVIFSSKGERRRLELQLARSSPARLAPRSRPRRSASSAALLSTSRTRSTYARAAPTSCSDWSSSIARRQAS